MEIDGLIGDIYDCAANPELWPQTLNKIRDAADLAYVMIGYMRVGSAPGPQFSRLQYSEWDPEWIARLLPQLPTIPFLDRLFQQGVDSPWTQMEHMPEAEFHQTDFYRNWVKPQRLRDGLNTLFISRKVVHGVMVMTQYEGKPLLGERERQIANLVSPHVRRAVAINETVDRNNLALALHRQVLDALSVAVFVVGAGNRMVFCNAKGERMLAAGDLLCLQGGRLSASRTEIIGDRFDTAMARAVDGDAALGIAGIGVPLMSAAGERAAAYVLPIAGRDLRSELGCGHATVFIAQRGEQQPMAIEILRTMFDLTPMEARVSYATSLGESPAQIATLFGVSLETVRSHLKRAFQKVDVRDKTALAASVTALIPPVEGL
jgi:DNA-binding CsgD family transcriptional regulator/PAS domain-containing protein